MSKPQNEITPFIRQCMALWFAENRTGDISVIDICQSLRGKHAVLADIDLTKAVSNELLRYEVLGAIEQIDVKKPATGRPAKLYKRRYCKITLGVMSEPVELNMLRYEDGKAELFVRGQGYKHILCGYKLGRIDGVRTLIKHHSSAVG